MNEIEPALRRAYALGQKYWQQADSDFARDNRKADETQAKFNQLVESMQGWLSPAEANNLRAQLVEAQRDAERGRWLIEHAFRYANVSLGSDMDGNPCVSIEPRFNIPEPTGLEYENGEWSVTDLRAAIDAAKGPA